MNVTRRCSEKFLFEAEFDRTYSIEGEEFIHEGAKLI